jgi:hypothetical protein
MARRWASATTGMILALLVTQLVAVPFSILFSKLSGKFGAIRMIIVAIAMYFCICGVGFFMGRLVEPYQLDYVASARASIARRTVFRNEGGPPRMRTTSRSNSSRTRGTYWPRRTAPPRLAKWSPICPGRPPKPKA